MGRVHSVTYKDLGFGAISFSIDRQVLHVLAHLDVQPPRVLLLVQPPQSLILTPNSKYSCYLTLSAIATIDCESATEPSPLFDLEYRKNDFLLKRVL